MGFTTEEYKDFISGALNGSDIITVGQAYYFAKLFNSMSDKFFIDGKADFSAPEFAALADFVKDNVQEKGREWESIAESDGFFYTNTGAFVEQIIRNPTALNVSYSGISGYITNMAEVHFGTAFVGIPSADGRGPAVAPNVSVAISSQAESIDACGEFVKILLSILRLTAGHSGRAPRLLLSSITVAAATGSSVTITGQAPLWVTALLLMRIILMSSKT